MTDQPAPRLARRRIAYGCLAGLLGMAFGAFMKTLDAHNADLLTAIAYVLGGVVLGYMGAQIAPEVFKKG